MNIVDLIHTDCEPEIVDKDLYLCPFPKCPKSFTRRSSLSRHLQIHSSERPFKCRHHGCSKSFLRRSALTVHTRTHTNAGAHACDTSTFGKLANDCSSLAPHSRTQTSQRRRAYAYDGCGERHSCNNSVVRHQTADHTPECKQKSETLFKWRFIDKSYFLQKEQRGRTCKEGMFTRIHPKRCPAETIYRRHIFQMSSANTMQL